MRAHTLTSTNGDDDDDDGYGEADAGKKNMDVNKKDVSSSM